MADCLHLPVMARRKQTKFEEIAERPNVLELGRHEYADWRGNWRDFFFGNHQPIALELGCGYGEYTTGLAAIFPGVNFVGIDVKGDRLWMGSGIALANGLSNVGFVRMQAQHLADIFAPGEVDEIWLPFPDPRSRSRDAKHRFTHPRFLEIYRNVLAPSGTVHLKTDSVSLFDYTLSVLREQPVRDLAFTRDLYRSEMNQLHRGLRTRYEEMFAAKGLPIHYLHFRFGE